MRTKNIGHVTALYGVLKGFGQRLLAALNTPERSDAPKTVGMFAGSLVSQDHETPHHPHSRL